ncbi:MAG: hypothetical protein HC830_13765 [Bacteroidetes bacterium]|nr:hypothetical protein [Bacteroidota bacterium]
MEFFVNINSFSMRKLLLTLIILTVCSILADAQRKIINLNGLWDIEESTSGETIPLRFNHKVEVPGLVNMAKPSFMDVDKFYGKEYYSNYWAGSGLVKLNIKADTMKIGYSFQKRNYFWYHKIIESIQGHELVILKINKAQFGTVVWIMGKRPDRAAIALPPSIMILHR